MASKLVVALIFIIDTIAFGLAVAAEQRRSTAKIQVDEEKNYNYCVYDSDISTGYGVAAFLLLLASQLLLMVVTQCFCCGKALRPVDARTWAVLLFIICCGVSSSFFIVEINIVASVFPFPRLFFLIAEVCLLAGSVRNAYQTKYRTILGIQDPPSCETLREGVFAAGAAFIFLNILVSELYYVCHSKAKSTDIGF